MTQPQFATQIRSAVRSQPFEDEPLPEAVIVKGLIDSASSFTLVAEMPHYIKLSRTAPAKFEQLRLLIEFMHQVTKE